MSEKQATKTAKDNQPDKSKSTSKLRVEDLKPQKISARVRISPLQVALSIRHLSIMLRSGIAIDAALLILIEQAEDEKLKKIFTNVLLEMQNGVSLADGLSKYPRTFSNIITSIVNVGEKGGSLENNLVFLADYLKKSHELQTKVKGALIYPMIILALTTVEMSGVIFLILPRLETLFSSFDNIPDYTVFILNMSKFIRDNGLAVLIGIIIVLFILNMFLRTSLGKKIKDNLAVNFPVVKLLNKNNTLTTFARTLAILLSNSIPISRALEITTETIENGVYHKILMEVLEEVKAGVNLADALEKHTKYFPPTFVRMISIGEETGALEDNLKYLYEFYADDVQEMSNNLATLLEPILLIFIGAMIGLLAVIIIGPIYQLTSSING